MPDRPQFSFTVLGSFVSDTTHNAELNRRFLSHYQIYDLNDGAVPAHWAHPAHCNTVMDAPGAWNRVVSLSASRYKHAKVQCADVYINKNQRFSK